MPLTPFQSDIFKVISSNRNPDSFVAGGTVINRSDTSPRYSDDIDLFHDTAQAVERSAEIDAETLKKSGFEVRFLRKESTFHQAFVSREHESVRIDWAADSAFRFLPVVADEVLGFRLHDADTATNKVLAAAGRQKVRDFIDLALLDETYISLGIAVWAAVGKDEGYTPSLIMQELRRNSLINPTTLGSVTFVHPQNAVALKTDLLKRFATAENLISTLPPDSLGCLYLDSNGQPARGTTFDSAWKPHYGSVKGAWPKIVD